MKKEIIIMAMLLLCLGLVAATWVNYNLTMANAGEIHNFDDGSNNKTFTYLVSENQSVYIDIPANAILTNANLTVRFNG